MSKAYVFIDEFGTPSLDTAKEGVTPYFIYAGVVIEESELPHAREVLKRINQTYFGGTPMKSNNIGNDSKGHAKRMKILSELADIKHYVVALLVDKSQIDSTGLTFKKSFIKFFNNLLSQQFVDKYEEYHIRLDKLGRKEFQEELKDYMRRKGHDRTLFSNNTFELKDDITEEPLIQISDFYCGCIGKNYCGNVNKNQAEALNNIIKSYVFIEWYPHEFVNYLGAATYKENEFNKVIADISMKSATNYLQTCNDDVGGEIVKLILQETVINPLRYISSQEIKRKISAKGIKIGDPITEIAKLRDKGVFIVSPIGKKGYKLPCSEKEVAEFFDRLISNVVPQLKRGYILHKLLVEQSFSAYNILAKREYSLLNDLMDTVINPEKAKINLFLKYPGENESLPTVFRAASYTLQEQ